MSRLLDLIGSALPLLVLAAVAIRHTNKSRGASLRRAGASVSPQADAPTTFQTEN